MSLGKNFDKRIESIKMNNSFFSLPDDVVKAILKYLSYAEIMNMKLFITLGIDNDLSFWWEMLNGENLYGYLTASLNLGYHNYIKAAMEYSKDNNLRKIFFEFGFLKDDNLIMKKYSFQQLNGLYDSYQKITTRHDTVVEKYADIGWNELKDSYSVFYEAGDELSYNDGYRGIFAEVSQTPYWEIFKICRYGYFTLKEYYKIISSALKHNRIPVLRFFLNWNLRIPSKYHPKRKRFDRLIHRYIRPCPRGQQRQLDLRKFELLINIYKSLIASEKELFNLIWTNYKIEQLDTKVKQLIVIKGKNKIQNEIFEMLRSDNVEKFKTNSDIYIKYIINNNLPIDNMIFYDSKLIKYMINCESNLALNIFARVELTLLQFKQCLSKMTPTEFYNFTLKYIQYFINRPHGNIQTIEYLVNSSYFNELITEKILAKYIDLKLPIAIYPLFMNRAVNNFVKDCGVAITMKDEWLFITSS